MKKTIFITALALVAAMTIASSNAEAFSLTKDKDNAGTEIAQEANIEGEATGNADMPQDAHSEEYAHNPELDPHMQEQVKKDPMVKELEEMQQKHFKEMQKKQAMFRKKKAEMMKAYKEKILKENPQALKEYITSCTERAIERYMRERGGYMSDPHMMDPAMMDY